ncbi:sodium-dependent transporter [Thiohalorhabdus methylotrophus]|uniref:Sodium-dependent transporter n=1 Tax=Thiohalorhabdus methylotrophus TaxID=3242694 RepID=A0ABV4TWH3_9GAMM
MSEQREQWQSTAGFIMAAIGSAVGLGNIWRFSYVTYENGGGAFLVPYILALFIVGIPLLMLEFGIGHYMKASAPVSLFRIDRRFQWVGWWAVGFTMFGILVYYCVVIAWCLNFIFFALYQPWAGMDGGANAFFFGEFLGASTEDGLRKPFELTAPRFTILVSLAVVWALNGIIVGRGLRGGVEPVIRVFIPMLFLLMIVLVIWSLFLPGAGQGLAWYLAPDWSKLADWRVWVEAITQIFFTLSLGFGIMIAYASYLPERSNITRNALITAFADSGFAIFAGVAVFATLGFMAQAQGQGVDQVVTSGIGLAFVAYPQVISELPFLPTVFGVLFFTALAIAGLSSSISIIQAFVSALSDKYEVNRTKVVGTVCTVGFLMGIVFTTGAGISWLDIVDHFMTSYGLVLVGLLEALIVGWVFGGERLGSHIEGAGSFRFSSHYGTFMRLLMTGALAFTWFGLHQAEDGLGTFLGRLFVLLSIAGVWLQRSWLDYSLKIIIPVALLGLLDRALAQEFLAPYGGYSPWAVVGIGLGWLLATLAVAVIIDLHSWRQEDRPGAD